MNRLEEEKKHLNLVVEVLSKELDNQKKLLKTIPENYKGRYADVKGGDEKLIEELMSTCRKRIKNLTKLEEKPYFGRFDFKEENSDVTGKHYIGKTNLFTSEANELILDWRAPICSLYYDQSIGKAEYFVNNKKISGELNLKSQILIENGEIKNIINTDLVSDDELLQPYLTINADKKMKDIVASIQKEQNSIIREPINKNIIVQGVAGSGKTSVALHRIAYLIYNIGKNYEAKNFIVLGPNKYFLNYISSVLPDLDTEEVVQATLEEVASEIIPDNLKIKNINSEEEKEKVSDKILKFKGSLLYKKALDNFLKDYYQATIGNGFVYNDFILYDKEFINSKFSSYTDINKKVKNISKIMSDKIKENKEKIFEAIYKNISKENKTREELIEIKSKLKKELSKGCMTQINQYFKKLKLSPLKLYRLFLENCDNYLECTPEDIKLLKESTIKNLKNKEVNYSDIAPLMYLSILIEKPEKYNKYVETVIDEAQDYSMFQLEVLKNIFKNSNFSIFGDLAQSVYSYRALDNWEEVKNKIFDKNCEIRYMNKSYRTTKEITEFSNNILDFLNLTLAEPTIRNGEDVKTKNTEDTDKNLISKTLNSLLLKEYKSIGIICKDENEMDEVIKMLENTNFNYNVVKKDDNEYNAGVNILTSQLAKGLEFDAVIINDASKEKYNSKEDMNLLYVSTTRALHELIVLYNGELCDCLEKHKVKTRTR